MENTDVEKHARACAARVDANAVGFDPATIISLISILIPLLSSCFKQTSATASPREYLEDHFDEDSGTFDQSLINRCRPQARRAARRDGQPRLSRTQLDAISAATLLQAKDEDQTVVVGLISEAA